MSFESDFGLGKARSQKGENLLIHRPKPLHQTGKQVPLRNGTPRGIIKLGILRLELRVIGFSRKLATAPLAFGGVNAAAPLALVAHIVQATFNMPAFGVAWMFVLRLRQTGAGLLQEIVFIMANGGKAINFGPQDAKNRILLEEHWLGRVWGGGTGGGRLENLRHRSRVVQSSVHSVPE